MGGITEIASGSPGYSSVLPNTASPIARTLKLNGYSTAQFGKCHEVPVARRRARSGRSTPGPPAAAASNTSTASSAASAPVVSSLYEGDSVELKKTPEEGYHLMADMTDKALAWVGQQKALAPDKPFFVYFAPGATHAPHHVPKEWADKYKGKFDGGWDKLREETFARQKALGVIPSDCQLTARHKEIPAWDDMPEDLKPVLRRQMEVYAGFLEYADHHVGRLLDGIDRMGLTDNTWSPAIEDNGLGRRYAQRHLQRDDQLQRRRGAGDAGVHDRPDRRVRWSGVLQPLRRGLGPRDEHALSMDKTGRLTLGRYPQRHDHPLAGRSPPRVR